jgi:hypothetical protein
MGPVSWIVAGRGLRKSEGDAAGIHASARGAIKDSTAFISRGMLAADSNSAVQARN